MFLLVYCLNTLYPNHDEYTFEEIRDIDENEGDESEKLNEYHIDHLRAYYMKKDINRLKGQRVW
jgi:hypothetical protein